MATHWYRVDVLEGQKTRAIIGTSELEPSRLVAKLSGDDYLVLNDLSYRDNKNCIVPFSEWDPRLGSIIYINPRQVVSVVPLVGDPRSNDSTRTDTTSNARDEGP
jgi:hypothetical protein